MRTPRRSAAAAALRELADRRRDGHTFLFTPRMLQRQPAGPRTDPGLILTDAPPLRIADVRPGGPAQRAGVRRGQAVLAINGEACAGLRRYEAAALLDLRAGATNELTVSVPAGGTRARAPRAEPAPRVGAGPPPRPVGRARVRGV